MSRLESVRRPAGGHSPRRQPQERREPTGRDAEGGRLAGLEVRRVPELALDHLLPTLLDGGPGRGRRVLRGANAGPETLPLFELARSRRIGFYLGYAELTRRRAGRATSTPRSWSPTAVWSASTARSICRAKPSIGRTPPTSISRRGTSRSAIWASTSGRCSRTTYIVGQCICNDRRWPETFRVMGLKGAEMVVLGYNTPSDNVYAPDEPPYLRVFHHKLSLPGRGLPERHLGRRTAKAGKEDGFWLHGGSVIVAPTGEVVAKGRPRRTRSSPTTATWRWANTSATPPSTSPSTGGPSITS